ncbi:hypothetical protein NC651_035167 [Populus alba x Populus x berolinensis]|nr:hypothetical protein NC651_035167 [Populus alba x Populus x berolinensis]
MVARGLRTQPPLVAHVPTRRLKKSQATGGSGRLSSPLPFCPGDLIILSVSFPLLVVDPTAGPRSRSIAKLVGACEREREIVTKGLLRLRRRWVARAVGLAWTPLLEGGAKGKDWGKRGRNPNWSFRDSKARDWLHKGKVLAPLVRPT